MYTYSAAIYEFEDNGDTQYDVRIAVNESCAKEIKGRKLNWFRTFKSVRYVQLGVLTKLMNWKFYKEFPIRNSGVEYHNVPLTLSAIINIINTEFDYHIGIRRCFRQENAPYLKKYLQDQDAIYSAPVLGHKKE